MAVSCGDVKGATAVLELALDVGAVVEQMGHAVAVASIGGTEERVVPFDVSFWSSHCVGGVWIVGVFGVMGKSVDRRGGGAGRAI